MELLVFSLFFIFLLLLIVSYSSALPLFVYLIGVLEANFIEPAHDKQDFERSTLYIRLETRLKQIVSDYWSVPLFGNGIYSV